MLALAMQSHGHGSSHHASFEVEDAAAHHSNEQACNPAEAECKGESASTHTACYSALSGHCSGSSATMGGTQFVAPSTRSLAASPVAPDAMSGLVLFKHMDANASLRQSPYLRQTVRTNTHHHSGPTITH